MNFNATIILPLIIKITLQVNHACPRLKSTRKDNTEKALLTISVADSPRMKWWIGFSCYCFEWPLFISGGLVGIWAEVKEVTSTFNNIAHVFARILTCSNGV